MSARKVRADDGRTVWRGGPLAVLVGGPLGRRWYLAADLDRMRREAIEFGRTPDDTPLLAYQRTTGTLEHPRLSTAGANWRYNPLPPPEG